MQYLFQMSSNICPFKFSSLDERKSSNNLYYEIFQWKMSTAPKNIDRFCDSNLNENERRPLVRWLRNLEDKSSSQYLQIIFSFSIPSSDCLKKIRDLGKPIISAGAGTGYWEYLLKYYYGVDVVAFDNNMTYPANMHYLTIEEGNSATVKNFSDRALFLAWPDKDEQSTFSLDCLHHYEGNIVIHVGEVFGETFSDNPWGQSTSRMFQLELGKNFRCMYRKRLPNWPGFRDSLSIWCKRNDPVECEGAMFCYVPNVSERMEC